MPEGYVYICAFVSTTALLLFVCDSKLAMAHGDAERPVRAWPHRGRGSAPREAELWLAMLLDEGRGRRFYGPHEEETYAERLLSCFRSNTLTCLGAYSVCRFWEIFDQCVRSPRTSTPNALRHLLASEFPHRDDANGLVACFLAFASYPGARLSFAALVKVLVEHYDTGHDPWTAEHKVARPHRGERHDYTGGGHEDPIPPARCVEFFTADAISLPPVAILFGLFPSALKLGVPSSQTPPHKQGCRRHLCSPFRTKAASEFAIERFPTEVLCHAAPLLVAFTKKPKDILGRGQVASQETLTAFFARVAHAPTAELSRLSVYGKCVSMENIKRLRVSRASVAMLRRAIVSTAPPAYLVKHEVSSRLVSRALCGVHRVRAADLSEAARAALRGCVTLYPAVKTFVRMGHGKRLRLVTALREAEGEHFSDFCALLAGLVSPDSPERSQVIDAHDMLIARCKRDAAKRVTALLPPLNPAEDFLRTLADALAKVPHVATTLQMR